MSDSFTLYRYWRPLGTKNSCAIAAGVFVDRLKNKASFTYAFCSPKEKVFTKAKARKIIDGRLACPRSVVTLDIDTDKVKDFVDGTVFDEAFAIYIEMRNHQPGRNGKVPRWAQKIYSNYLEFLYEEE